MDGQVKARFTDEQILGVIKEQECGEKTADVCRCHASGNVSVIGASMWYLPVKALSRTGKEYPYYLCQYRGYSEMEKA